MSFETKKICTFFLQNQCTKGTACRFEHTIVATTPRRPPCKFFLENKCTLGSNCRFEHKVRTNSYSDEGSFPQMSGSSNPSLLSSSQTPGNVRPAKLPVDQRTATHSDNSQPKSNSSQPKSDPNRIVKGEINGLTFQVEIVDPSSIFALAPCRDIDEETDYSYVEPEPMITAMASPDSPRTDSEITIKGKKSDAITSKYTQQLDELEMRVKELQVDDLDGHEEQFGNTSDYSEYSDVQPAHPPKICKFYQQGNCRYGKACIYSHSIPIDPNEERLMQQELLDSQAVECNICMDLVLRQGERFGLLSDCDHAFCLKCVRNKDNKETIRNCPVCQADIAFVVPSNRYVQDPKRRAQVIAEYKRNVAQIPCRHFALGRGTCPFGTACFYEHRYADGSLQERDCN
ncbi:hypothetical protein LEN26_010374 [Aphanomyces euteiches]|nr:hypothetical protein AeMF1_018834 [Aphanomyces euteiches]KAH9122118.1 hypothetical protein LEN26_010374 [Aphanomyces euteiches]KAH9196549.1 hypothetical protein AeNC1_001486 [Aphanomyces euteiches]